MICGDVVILIFAVQHYHIVWRLRHKIKTWHLLAIFRALQNIKIPYVPVIIIPFICQNIITWWLFVVEDVLVVEGGWKLCPNKQVSEEMQQQQQQHVYRPAADQR